MIDLQNLNENLVYVTEARKHCSVKLALNFLTEVKVIVLGGLTTKEIHLFLLILQILANKLDFMKGSFLN